MEPKFQRTVLYQTEAFEIVAIEWRQGAVSEMHGHGWSQCLVLVEEGVFENTLDLGLNAETQLFEPGQVIRTPVGARHRIVCRSETARTLHVYLPKIEALEAKLNFASSPGALKQTLALGEPTQLPGLMGALEQIRRESVATHSPYFMNQLFAGIVPQMLLAEELVLKTKTTMATQEASPVFSDVEGEVVRALGNLLGWSDSHGICVPGGSAANFMALHCARQRAYPAGKQRGHGRERYRVYTSSGAHYSLKKACVVLGLGLESLVEIPVDDIGRLDARSLRVAIRQDQIEGFRPLMVCATAGTTVFGAFDPIQEISVICREEGLWLHVDAAWGGPALFTPRLRGLLGGSEYADSVTFDAHKLFGAGLTSSFFLTPHRRILGEANDVSGAEYIFHGQELDRGPLSWQCGRKADALGFWAIWKSAGTEGLGAFVDRQLQIRAEVLAFIARTPRLELVAQPEYLNVCVRVRAAGGENHSRRVREALIAAGLAMVNFSTDAQGPFLRLILAHPYLEFRHVEEILTAALAV